MPVKRKLLIPRLKSSYAPTAAYFFFGLPEDQLCNATELILDFPGGGFVAQNPEHHEERLRIWAQVTRRPVLSIDYGKAPECSSTIVFCMRKLSLFFSRSIPLCH